MPCRTARSIRSTMRSSDDILRFVCMVSIRPPYQSKQKGANLFRLAPLPELPTDSRISADPPSLPKTPRCVLRRGSCALSLQCAVPCFPCSNPDDVSQGGHKDLSVPNSAVLGCPQDRLNDFLRKIVGDDDFDFCFRHKLDRVLGAAVGFLLPFLATV